ncbi:hypothetical protein JKP88DRAFT_181425, partial [Tribonema minus]
RVGYHAVPSLEPLHLHVISQDLDGHSMKTPKHWNTFATPFFLETEVCEPLPLAQNAKTLQHMCPHCCLETEVCAPCPLALVRQSTAIHVSAQHKHVNHAQWSYFK